MIGSPDRSLSPLEYYATQSKYTNPGKFAKFFDNLPTSIPDLCSIAHNTVIDFAFTRLFDLELPEERIKDVQNRYVEKILERSQQIKAQSLNEIREPKDRVAGTCRDFAILLCSMLRHQKVPARLRCGFEIYFKSGKFEDHWIVEYWDKAQKRWILVDPEVSDVEKEKEQVDVNQFDIPRDQYLVAGDAWQKCRNGKLDPMNFGVSTINIFGPWFVRANVIRDLAALNKVEVLPWEYNSYADNFIDSFGGYHRKDLERIDSIAALTNPGNNDQFAKIIEIYGKNPQLQMAGDITSYTPLGIQKIIL